jgi:hypothetical protein
MSCSINIPDIKSKVRSTLFDEILEYSNQDAEKAVNLYDITRSDKFINKFGDWIENINTPTETVDKDALERINNLGEPKLFTNKYGRKFFKMPDGEKYFLDKSLLNYSAAQINSLISMSIHYLLGEDPTSAVDIQSINPNDLFEYNEGANDAYYILQGDKQSLTDLKELVLLKLGLNENTLSNREIIANEGIDVGDAENKNDIDLISSNEKNSKDNANKNIKFLLSYIPKFTLDEEGNSVLDTVNFVVNGVDEARPVYTSFDEIWAKFEEPLANIIPHTSEGTISDLFEEMISKLRSTYGTTENFDPTVMYAIEKLITNLTDYKKNMFVHAFMKVKLDYYTVIVNREGGKLNLKYIKSISTNSRIKQIKDEYKNGVIRSSLVDPVKNTYDQDKALDYKDNLKGILQSTQSLNYKTFTRDTLNTVASELTKLLNKVGIDVESKRMQEVMLNEKSKEGLKQDAINIIEAASHLFDTLADTTNVFITKNGKKTIQSPLKAENKFFDKLATVEAKYRKDISENTVLGPNNKMFWVYSLPNFLNVKLSRLKQEMNGVNVGINKEYSNRAYTRNSVWREKLADKFFMKDFNIIQFLNIKNEDNKNIEDKDNKTITLADQIVEIYNKVVLKKKIDGDIEETFSITNTLTPADRKNASAIQNPILIDVDLEDDGSGVYGFGPEVLDVYRGYAKDEYFSAKEAYDEVLSPDDNNLFQYYHYDKDGKMWKDVDGRRVPAGNGIKFTIFEELNHDNPLFIDYNERFNVDGNNLFYTDRKKEEELFYPRLDEEQFDKLLQSDVFTNYLKEKLTYHVNDSLSNLRKYQLIKEDGTANDFIDEGIFRAYRRDDGDVAAVKRFVAESMLNQHISNIEYTKLFTGNPLFYKSLSDFSKRVPATYSDGIHMNLLPGDDIFYNMAVMPDIIYKDTKYYPKVDATDGQGWITMARWEFIQRRLNKWTPTHDEILQRIKDGKETDKDIKFITAQPLKGVYFDVKNGVPTYVKYSQFVLVPKAIKGTDLEKLNNAMLNHKVEDEIVPIHEAVSFSAVKVGAKTLSTLPDMRFSDNMTLEVLQLTNLSWKLQQDLPSKGMHPTLIGSQLQKILLRDLDYSDPKMIALSDRITSIIGNSSDIGLTRLASSIGLNPMTGDVSNRELFYDKFIDELNRNNAEPVALEQLKREYPLNYILANRLKFQSIIASMVNTATVKLKSNGGAFVQSSSFGWTMKEATNAGVKMLVDETELKNPDINEKTGKVQPGQIFIPHTQIAKYIPNYRSLPPKKLKEMINSKLLTIIGYRIPTQDLASTDALEIIGILPPGMGDVVVPYINITAKTGSDFDIDKIFLMIPEMQPVFSKLTYKKGRDFIKENNISNQEMYSQLEKAGYTTQDLERIDVVDVKTLFIKEILFGEQEDTTYFDEFDKQYPKEVEYLDYYEDTENTTTQKGLNNKLIEEYIGILTNPDNFNRLVESIDNTTLEDDINKLTKNNKKAINEGFTFFTPEYQLIKKFENFAGQDGTGIAANHSTDQYLTQRARFKMNIDLGVGYVNAAGETEFFHINSKKRNPISKTSKKEIEKIIKNETDLKKKQIDELVKRMVEGDTSNTITETPSTISFIKDKKILKKEVDASKIFPEEFVDEEGPVLMSVKDIQEELQKKYDDYLEMIKERICR